MDLNTLLRTQWDRAAAIGCTVLGALLLVIGWVGVSDTAYVAEQVPYVASGGVGGLFLLAVGATLWVSADLRDEWRKLDRIEEAMVGGALRWVADEAPEPAPVRAPIPVPAGTGTAASRAKAKSSPVKPRVRTAASSASDA